ncbi:MAG TPA: nitroreductase family deazaflavin-dependent oxidoreductase [Solirubrobacteraceae bacterium]|nr:nitroreductase family deazaflavin-dependent oxidoreductase [Solirubrobacteraceae bacterium]
MTEPVDNPESWVAEHIRRYAESDGADGHDYLGWPTLLLTTRGRRSGRLRRTALIYGRDEGRFVIVASNGGKPQDPAWYRNLLADPAVSIQVGPDRYDATAAIAPRDERPHLWALMAAIFPQYDAYARAAPREIPVVLLRPGGSYVSLPT